MSGQFHEAKSVRMSTEQLRRMQRVCSRHHVGMQDLIRRGIELACDEVERKAVDEDRKGVAEDGRTTDPDTS